MLLSTETVIWSWLASKSSNLKWALLRFSVIPGCFVAACCNLPLGCSSQRLWLGRHEQLVRILRWRGGRWKGEKDETPVAFWGGLYGSSEGCQNLCLPSQEETIWAMDQTAVRYQREQAPGNFSFSLPCPFLMISFILQEFGGFSMFCKQWPGLQ